MREQVGGLKQGINYYVGVVITCRKSDRINTAHVTHYLFEHAKPYSVSQFGRLARLEQMRNRAVSAKPSSYFGSDNLVILLSIQ